MSRSDPIIDVFVTHARVDKPIADNVVDRLRAHGLHVTTASLLEQQRPRILSDLVRDTIAESTAVVALVGPQSIHNPNVMFEIGAAFAWNKACFLITNGVNTASLPISLSSIRVYSLSDVEQVAKDILDARVELSEEDTAALSKIYEEVGVPVDSLFSRPAALSRITREFNGSQDRSLSSEMLLQHLLRLRKQSRLARIQRQVDDEA
jgi:hypothetical protein